MAGEAVYSTKQVADTLALSSSSVRKYCAELEAAGKVFVKSEAGARLFDELDLKTLRHMQRAIGKGASYKNAAEQAVKAVKMHEVIIADEPTPADASNAELKAVIGELVNEVRKMRGEIGELKQAELNRQEAEVLRIEQAEAEAQQDEEIEEQPAKKPGLFSRFFK